MRATGCFNGQVLAHPQRRRGDQRHGFEQRRGRSHRGEAPRPQSEGGKRLRDEFVGDTDDESFQNR